MYCPNCGSKNNYGAKFCSDCGCKFVTTAVKQGEALESSKKKSLKSKEVYIKELETSDSGYQFARFLQVLFLILFGFLGIIGSVIMRNQGFSDGAPWWVFSLLSFAAFVIDSGYLIHKNNQFRDIYENYLRNSDNPTTTSSQSNDIPIMTHERYWDCPNCGRCNDNIFTTCKCGERKP